MERGLDAVVQRAHHRLSARHRRSIDAFAYNAMIFELAARLDRTATYSRGNDEHYSPGRGASWVPPGWSRIER